MGRSGPLTLVTPAEFKARTSLTLSSRSGSTVTVDKAYENFHATRSPVAAKILYDSLQQYLMAHGGSWDQCDRNVVSGGLMEFVYHLVGPGAMSPAAAAEMDRRAQARIRDIEIPHARFGVLYFLSNLKVEADALDLVVDTLKAVGGAVGVGMTTNFNQLGNAKLGTQGLTKVAGYDLQASHVTAVGAPVVKAVGRAIDAQLQPGAPTSASWLPLTEMALERAGAGLSEVWDENRYTGALAYAGAGLAAAPVVAATLVADGALALKRLAKALWEKVSGAVRAVGDMLKRALGSSAYDPTKAGRYGKLIKTVGVVAVDFILKNAIPFLGGAVELGSGLARAIMEAGSRLASAYDRRHIRLQAGHPEELANAIERQMTRGIQGGLLTMLTGSIKVAVGVFLPGLGALASAVVSGIEWMVKMVCRLSELSGIQHFLHRARALYDTEKRRARTSNGVFEPNTSAGGVITDTAAFTAFFREGCEASPLIPMLTLNSGLGGSLMTMLQLFEADGSQSARATRNVVSGETREFDRASAYFTRLKYYSVRYMRDSGFKVLPLNPTDKLMSGYIAHATGMGKSHMSHVLTDSTLTRVGQALAAC